jgi:isopenicillin-N N-acyltransferase-like protein
VDAEALLAINARTELLSPLVGGECSLLAEAGDGGAVIAQNWDWHPALAGSLVVWRVRRPDGSWFATLTEAGMLAKLGVSSAGVACGLNFLRSSRDGVAAGIPVHVLLRVVLDRCESVGAALRLLATAPVRASACLTLAGADGVTVAIELSPGGWRLVFPGADGRLAHTNHFLAGPAAGEDLEALEAPSTALRLWDLRRLDAAAPLDAALRSHVGAPESVCRHEREADPWPERRATLASVVLDAGARSMRVAPGPPCSTDSIDVALA